MLAWFSLTAETILLNGAADTKENHFQTLWPGEKKKPLALCPGIYSNAPGARGSCILPPASLLEARASRWK